MILSDRLFDENEMYAYIETFAAERGLARTLEVLPFAREEHAGQMRKGKGGVPYIYHPLLVACHALALGLDDDDMISAALLHDVCEDCGVAPEELPVNDRTREAVALLTKGEVVDKAEYFAGIGENPIATMIKLLDRCNNVSGMAGVFGEAKLAEYIEETEEYVYPLMDLAERKWPEYRGQVFLMRYHMKSVVESIKRMG